MSNTEVKGGGIVKEGDRGKRLLIPLSPEIAGFHIFQGRTSAYSFRPGGEIHIPLPTGEEIIIGSDSPLNRVVRMVVGQEGFEEIGEGEKGHIDTLAREWSKRTLTLLVEVIGVLEDPEEIERIRELMFFPFSFLLGERGKGVYNFSPFRLGRLWLQSRRRPELARKVSLLGELWNEVDDDEGKKEMCGLYRQLAVLFLSPEEGEEEAIRRFNEKIAPQLERAEKIMSAAAQKQP